MQGLDACRGQGRQALPCSLSTIVTPMIEDKWEEELHNHPDQGFAEYILKGIKEGFRVGINPSLSKLKPRPLNMPSVEEHPKVVAAYVQEERSWNRDDWHWWGQINWPRQTSTLAHLGLSPKRICLISGDLS